MVKSMFAAVAGLKAHQSKMDVIGNNIANVNTPGYKSQMATFKDSLYVTMTQPSGASTADGGSGGLNASQLGYGSLLSNITTDFGKGTPSYTGRPMDVMCNGTGFFAVGPNWGDAAQEVGNIYLSRVGQFTFKNGYIVDSNGYYLYGCPTTDAEPAFDDKGVATGGYASMDADYKVNADTLRPLKIPSKITVPDTSPGAAAGATKTKDVSWQSFSIDSAGKITGTTTDNDVVTVGYLPVVNVDNPNGMIHNEAYYYSLGSTGDDGAAGKATILNAGGTAGALLSSYLESPNVDLAQQFSEMITTQRGFQANTKMITVTDQMLEELVNLKR